jgi:hypothetical protein
LEFEAGRPAQEEVGAEAVDLYCGEGEAVGAEIAAVELYFATGQ